LWSPIEPLVASIEFSFQRLFKSLKAIERALVTGFSKSANGESGRLIPIASVKGATRTMQ
jgi:hypothetical protein